MKNHIVFKFLALLLCAASLLTTIGSGAAIVVMTTLDLYNKTVDQVYEEHVQTQGSYFAQKAASAYAGVNLGGCPEAIVPYYETGFSAQYDEGGFGWSLLDAEGNVLTGENPEAKQTGALYTFPVSGQYMHLVSLEPAPTEFSGSDTLPLDGQYGLYDLVPEEGVVVGSYCVLDGTSGQGLAASYADSESEGIGLLFRNSQNQVVFHPTSGLGDQFAEDVSHIAFWDTQGRVIYEASGPETVGSFTLHNGRLTYVSQVDPVYWGTQVCGLMLFCDGSSQLSLDGIGPIGYLTYDETGCLTFLSTMLQDPESVELLISASEQVQLLLTDEPGNLLFDSTAYAGTYTFDPCFRFTTDQPVYSADASAETTSPAEATVPAEEIPAETVSPETAPQEEQVPGETAPQEEQVPGETAPQEEQVPDETAPQETAAQAPEEAPAETGAPSSGSAPEEEGGAETAAPETEAPQETVVPETEAPQETAPPETQPTAALEPVPATPSVPTLVNGKPLDEYEIYSETFSDPETGQTMRARYVYTPLPEYTVELYLDAGSSSLAPTLDLLRILRSFRNDLFLFLGASLLIFAASTVYLCCAAGRKPKSDQIQPGGLNRMPLDLYAALVAAAAGCFVVFLADWGSDLLARGLGVAAGITVLSGYLLCLLIVAFGYGFTAQLKAGGGCWWRGTLCGRFLRGCVRLALWLERWLSTRFFPWLWKLIKGLCSALVRWCKAGYRGLSQLFSRFGKSLHRGCNRFLSMLPLTWQWLTVGICLVLFLLGSLAFGSVPVFLFFLALALGVVLYGARAFGTLLQSAKRMRKGDLSTHVDDRHLVGSFAEFAEDLNGLAGVAVTAAQKQLKSERMKTELITNVSHDIKTPLTSIINYVDLLQKPHTDQEQEQYLEVLARQSQQLKKLIDDLIEMSKASTGNMAVDITQLDAVEVVNQSLGEFADKLGKVQLQPVFRHTEATVPMMADGRLAWRVMNNLLSNAVKYAMPGTRLYVDLSSLDGKVVLSVKNISRDELNIDADELMERFVRGDGSRNTEGSGLGLNIAKSLMELQRGQLELLVDGDLFKVTLIFPGVPD